MHETCVIAGVGLVTPLGVGVGATWDALLKGDFVTDLGRVAIGPHADVARVSQLGLSAAREAIGDADVADAALIVGTSKGPADEWLRRDDAAGKVAAQISHHAVRPARPTLPPSNGHRRFRLDGLADGVALADPPINDSWEHRHTDHPWTGFGLHTLAADLARALEISGPRLTLSAACASGLHALARAVLMLRCGDTPRAVVVASESSLDPIWSGSFRRLGVLAPPGQPCRPFDEERHGFVMSEAAAAVVLEWREPRPGEIAVESALLGGDASHLTSPDPESRLLKHLISRSTGDSGVTFVHAHATATGSDATELAAVAGVLAPHRPLVYSHKGSLGHTLGASGLVGVVINTQVHRTGMIPPHPTTRRTIDAAPLRIAGPAPTRQTVRDSLCLAAGFGGATAVARLRSF